MFAKRSNVYACCGWVWLLCLLAPNALAGEEALNLAHIPPGAVAAAVVHPERLAQSPELELVPWEVIQASAQHELGFDPLVIRTAIAVAAAPTGDGPPDWGLILHFSRPQELAERLLARTEAAAVGEVAYRRAGHPTEPSFCPFDSRTLLIGTEPMLREMIRSRDAASPLREILANTPMRNDVTAVLAVSPIRDLVKQFTAAVPLPPPLQPLLEIPDQVDSVVLAVNLSRERMSGIQLTATDEAAARKLETTLQQGLAFAKQMLLGQMMQAMPGDHDDPAAEAMQRYLIRMTNTIEARLQPVRTGNELVITLTADYATSGVLVALLLPAVQSARAAARRAQSMNNLKQLALAMHNYHDTFRHFPAAYNSDVEGKPLLSWRVHLLPFLEQRILYEQFRLDEPWDSPHNRQLIAQMPDVFRSPSSTAPPGKTNYLGVRGEAMTFVAPKQPGPRPAGSRLADFRGGTSNALMIVEAGDALAVEWTRPADYEPDETQPLDGLVGLHPGGFQGAMADGSVRSFSSQIDPELLMRLFRRADGPPHGVRFE